MTALAGPPVTVAAITAGLCGWLVVDEPVELGRHALAATDDADSIDAASQRFSRDYPGPLVWYGRGRAWLAIPGDKPAPSPQDAWYPVPVGRVAATVTVTHCLPIVEREWTPEGFQGTQRDVVATMPPGHPAKGHVHLWLNGEYADNLTEQTIWQSGGWLPGRWALKVTDPTPRSDQ